MLILNKGTVMKKYSKLYNDIKEQIITGQLSHGDKIPSVRDAAAIYSVSTTTVQNAYFELCADGYIISKEKSGYFVSIFNKENQDKDSEKSEVKIEYNFCGESADPESFDLSLWQRYIKNALRQKDRLLTYSQAQGEYDLRCAVSKYIREKSKFLENCGFEEGYGKIQFSVNGEAGIRNIIDVSLGLEEELDVENLPSIEERFGIPSKKSEFKLSNAKLRIGMSTPKKGKVRFKEDHLSSGLMFDIEFYTPPFNFHDFRKYAKFRIVGDFFDIACEPYVGKAHYTFSLGDDQKLKLGKLKDAVSLICLLSRDKQIAIFELDLEGFELLSFTLTSKYIKRELTIFNELLEKASQICEYANVSE